MRVVKPFRASTLQRSFEASRQHKLAVAALGFFPFDAPEAFLPEVSLWKTVGKELADTILDEGMPKPRGEVLVFGRGFAPGGAARPGFPVRVKVGPVDRTLYAFGPRHWKLAGPSEPEPIRELPIDWAHAFGGEGHEPNPLGVGAAPIQTKAGKIHPLPQLEDPKRPVTSPSDKPLPASFGPLDLRWPQRAKHRGTYDAKWLEEDFPGLARDLDPEFFMVASPEQRLPGWLEPGAEVTLENLHAEKPRLTTRVPALVARCFYERAGSEELHELPMRAETLFLFPNIERGLVLFRGLIDVATFDGSDLRTLLLGFESPGAPRGRSHYAEVLKRRLDKTRGVLAALRDKDLMPEAQPGAPSHADEKFSDMQELLATEGVLAKRGRARMERDLEKTRRDLLLLGVDPDAKGVPRELPAAKEPPALDELAEYLDEVEAAAADQQELAKAQQAKALDEARKVCAERGIDFDEEVEKRKKEAGGPPKFRAAAEIRSMEGLVELGRAGGTPYTLLEERLADPRFRKTLERAEEAQLDVYRRFAQHFPGAWSSDEARARAREGVLERLRSGASFANEDLTGADLRGLSFAGRDLRRALFEGALAAEVDFSGADLEGAVLTRASLAGARFEGAKLREANLGEADLTGAALDDADLSGAVLMRTTLKGASLARANLSKADLLWAVLDGARLDGAVLTEMMLFQVDVSRVRFRGTKLTKTLLVQCRGEEADFGEADAEALTLVEFTGPRARFDGAKAKSLRVVGGSTLTGASFAGAELGGAVLRGLDLASVRLEGARADAADFSESDLSGANARGLSARGGLFVRTKLVGADLRGANLMDALLLGAKLDGAKAERANLFRATLLGAEGDARTSFAGALVKRTTMPKKK